MTRMNVGHGQRRAADAAAFAAFAAFDADFRRYAARLRQRRFSPADADAVIRYNSVVIIQQQRDISAMFHFAFADYLL